MNRFRFVVESPETVPNGVFLKRFKAKTVWSDSCFFAYEHETPEVFHSRITSLTCTFPSSSRKLRQYCHLAHLGASCLRSQDAAIQLFVTAVLGSTKSSTESHILARSLPHFAISYGLPLLRSMEASSTWSSNGIRLFFLFLFVRETKKGYDTYRWDMYDSYVNLLGTHGSTWSSC